MVLTIDSQPLDVFEDFEIRYAHIFDDASSLSGRRIPYTNNFKVPLTDRNRNMLGIPFDISQPKLNEVKGSVNRDDGTVVFSCIYQVQSQVVNVLEPYLEISMIDVLSDTIASLSDTYFYEILTGAGTDFTFYDEWIYGDGTQMPYQDTAPFIFPFMDYNNKLVSFAHDPMRNITQLQPTWHVWNMTKMIFKHFGVNINSRFLSEDDQIYPGINKDRLFLTLPVSFFSDSECLFSAKSQPRGQSWTNAGASSWVSRSPAISSPTPTCSRLEVEDFSPFLPNTEGPKMSWKRYLDYQAGFGNPIYSSEYCSMVDGKMNISSVPLATTNKLQFLFGALRNDARDYDNTNQYGIIEDVVNPVFTGLELHMVIADFTDIAEDNIYTKEKFFSQAYDGAKTVKIGTVEYIGAEYLNTLDAQMVFEATIDTDAQLETLVQANKSITLSFVIVAPEGSTATATLVIFHEDYGSNHLYHFSIEENRYEYAQQDSEPQPEDDFDSVLFGARNIDEYLVNITYSYPEATEYPPVTEYWHETDSAFAPLYPISLLESYKGSENQYKLIDIVKMIMERFNLSLYSLANGSIWIDSAENRSSGQENITPLIDNSVVVDYKYNEYGLFEMKDNNPDFYPDGFNTIEDLVFNKEKKETATISLSSSIVRVDGMFEDVYDDTSYDLLKAYNNSDYWGVSDRLQVSVEDMLPSFCFMDTGEVKIMFPISSNTKSTFYHYYGDDSENDYLAEVAKAVPGFYNYFDRADSTKTFWHSGVCRDNFAGYSLISFEDNEVISDWTTYFVQWRKRVYQLMDNETINLSMDLYISPEKFLDFTSFPIIDYFGDTWEMLSFDNFPFSAQNGGIANMKMVQEPVLLDPLPPSASLTSFLMHSTGNGTSELACDDTILEDTYYHNGTSIFPQTEDGIFYDLEGTNAFIGEDNWYRVDGNSSAIRVSSLGIVSTKSSCNTAPTDPPILLGYSNDDQSTVCHGTTSSPNERWHSGAGTYPIVGDIVYIDVWKLTPLNGYNLWYRCVESNEAYEITFNGSVTQVTTCTQKGFTVCNEFFTNPANTCLDDTYPRTFLHSGAGEYPTVGDTTYYLDGNTINGTGKWGRMGSGELFTINGSGVVTNIDTCP